jgi:NADPH2:quinone reductase
MRAIEVSEFGGPDVLRLVELPDPVPGPGQVLVDVEVSAVVFVDTFTRAGTGPAAGSLHPPFVPGNGVGGVITALGTGVDPGLAGRRVVTPTGGTGGYAQRVVVAVDGLVDVPDGLPMDQATALLADGRTAILLTGQAAPAPGEWVLIEAAGGGVGILLVQLAHRAGARVIAAAGGDRKLAQAAKLGAVAGVDYRRPDWVQRVREATGGAGVDVLFESVGGDIARDALSLVADGGRRVVFGYSSGAPAAVDPAEQQRRGIQTIGFFGRRWTPEELRGASAEALARAVAGELTPVIGQTYPLARAADAHRDIEARTTLGKTLLLP